MTVPGLNLPGNLSIDDIIGLFKNARETGKAVLEALREAVKSNPQLQALLKQFEAIFGKPVIELTDAELTDLIGSWHAGLTKKSKPMQEDPPPPPPPPPPPGSDKYDRAWPIDPILIPEAVALYAPIDVRVKFEGKYYVMDGRAGTALPPGAEKLGTMAG